MLSVLDFKPGSELSTLGLGCLALLAMLLIPGLAYTLSLQKAFSRISPEHREMEPTRVWLLLIPLFGFIWHFLVVAKLSKSFRNSFKAQGIEMKDPSFGMLWGMLFGGASILICAGPALVVFYPALKWVELVLGAGVIIIWLIWWAKLISFGRKLAQ